ncbi:Heparin-sulfate lyase [bacterium HR15]|nr:Heparin-sulfate lyase [bacterium HR15]
MEPHEILIRTARLLREWLAPLPKEPPETTWQRLCPQVRMDAWLTQLMTHLPIHPTAVPPSERARILKEADDLLQGNWRLFGYTVLLDNPPCWHRNYLLGKEWMDAPAKIIDYRRIDVAGGVKYVWELARHQPILRLAQAYALTGESRYAETCLRWWLDYLERNPRGWGIHWTSALEHAIRVFVWLYTLRLLASSAQGAWDSLRTEGARLLGAILQHGEYIERHLSPGSSANNHLIGEAAALAFAGSLLPDCPLTRRWRHTGYTLLEREALRQFYPDGVNAEQAFGYLPFVWEFYLHAYRLHPMPTTVAERLIKSIEFVRNVIDASGYVPQVGDEDDGTVVPLWSEGGNRHRVVGRALAMMLDCEPPPAFSEVDDTLCLWLSGTPAPTGSRLTESRLYPEGGYAVLHKEPWQVLFDAGPLGLGNLAAHGHADALSVWASLDGKPFLIDAGTYAYHEDPEWRNYFRGTSAHNTIALNGENQSGILGPFLWGRKAWAYLSQTELTHDAVVGELGDYLPEAMVARRVELHRQRLLITDVIASCFEGDFPDFMRSLHWHWHFHPDWQVELTEEGWHIRDGERVCLLRVEGLPPNAQTRLYRGDERTKLGWYSPRFGHKLPCHTLQVVAPASKLNIVRWEFQKQ